MQAFHRTQSWLTPTLCTPNLGLPPELPASDDSFVSAMDEERVIQVKQEITMMWVEGAETWAKLDQLTATMAQLLSALPPANRTHEMGCIINTMDPPKTQRAKPASPPEFNGDCTKGLAFLKLCQTYIQLCPDNFWDEQAKIVWAMSYMKASQASKWTTRIFRWEDQPENSDATWFLDWNDFHNEFKKEFTPAHANLVALNWLESMAYYQRSWSLDDYLGKFLDLVADSGYTDPKTIVLKFRRGLNPEIQNAVATWHLEGHLTLTQVDGWYDMAQTIDENWATNEAFASSQVSCLIPSWPVSLSVAWPTLSVVPQLYAHSTPTPGNPVLMDINTARRKSQLLCFRCKKPGYFGNNCPDQFDIWMLTMDELQSALEDWLAQLYMPPAEPTSPPLEKPANLEDFQQHNEWTAWSRCPSTTASLFYL